MGLFGLGGGGGNNKTEVKPWKPQRQHLENIFERAEDLSGNVPGYYPGNTVAGFNPDINQAMDMRRQYATGQGQQVAQNAAGQQQFIMDNALNPQSNPYLQQYMDAATRGISDNYTRNVVPSINQNALMSGGVGGSAQGVAQGIAAGDYLRQVGDTTAQIGSNAYGQGLDAYMQALALAPQTYQLGMMPSQAMGELGDYQRQYQQQLLDADQARYWYEQNAPWEALRNYQGAVSGSYGGQTNSPGNQTNPIMAGLGGALAGSQIGGMFPGIGQGLGAGIGAALPLIFG